ncbi:phosphorylcholine transferase LicD, partial [Methanobrevibacter sp.]|uniref:LicD family protein n=1 Tax=Methanobrevibacter sp. TaxID=66852 RepID=UPI00388DD18C
NSYNFYKDFYEKYNGVSSKQVDVQIAKLQKEFRQYKKRNDEYIDSFNFLFNKIFLDYELTNPNPLLDNMQKLCIQLLEFVENVCIKYDLEWWIDVGNLLGAVRHGYFVPWDDDVDIGMMRTNYNKFVGVIENEIREHNLDDIIHSVYKPRKIDKTEVGSFIQLYVRHPVSNKPNPRLAGVDVFPYDYIRDYNKESINDEYYDAKRRYYRNLSKNIDYEVCLKGLYDDLNLSKEKTDYVIPGVEGGFGKYNIYKLMILDTDKVFPLTQLKYGDRTFPAPKDYHYYLKNVYGDYMSVPKNLHRHPRIENLRYATDANEVYEKLINRFITVNENFK